MKAIFVAYNQAFNEEIVEVLEAHGQRGYTAWQDIQGRGNVNGRTFRAGGTSTAPRISATMHGRR